MLIRCINIIMDCRYNGKRIALLVIKYIENEQLDFIVQNQPQHDTVFRDMKFNWLFIRKALSSIHSFLLHQLLFSKDKRWRDQLTNSWNEFDMTFPQPELSNKPVINVMKLRVYRLERLTMFLTTEVLV